MVSGWFRESYRHRLAAKGVSTRRYMRSKWKDVIASRDELVTAKFPEVHNYVDRFNRGLATPNEVVEVAKSSGAADWMKDLEERRAKSMVRDVGDVSGVESTDAKQLASRLFSIGEQASIGDLSRSAENLVSEVASEFGPDFTNKVDPDLVLREMARQARDQLDMDARPGGPFSKDDVDQLRARGINDVSILSLLNAANIAKERNGPVEMHTNQKAVMENAAWINEKFDVNVVDVTESMPGHFQGDLRIDTVGNQRFDRYAKREVPLSSKRRSSQPRWRR